MEYNKLVRDNIPEIIKKSGEVPVTRMAEDQEYEAALIDKLHEEVAEFLATPSAEEAADVLEVLYALGQLNGVDMSQVETVRQAKAIERGAFAQ